MYSIKLQTVNPEIKGLYLTVILLFYCNVRAAVPYAVKPYVHITEYFEDTKL